MRKTQFLSDFARVICYDGGHRYMKGSFSRSAIFSLAATAAVVFSPCALAQGDSAPAPETARRRMALRDAMQEVQAARGAYTEKKYSQAVEHYRNALAVLPQAPATEKQQIFIKDSLSDALIATAMDYRAVGRTDEALTFLKEAIELSPKNSRARQELARTEDPARTNPALTPQHIGNVEEVNRLLTLGYGQLDLGNYDKAISSFEAALRIDKTNSAARRGIEAAHKRRSAYLSSAHDSFRAQALNDVDKLWEEPLPVDHALVTVAEQTSEGEVLEDAELQSRIGAAIKEMVLPQVVFDDVPVSDVVDALQAQITRFESSGASDAGRHINLTANFGTVGSEGYNDIMSRRVNLNLSDVSVAGVLDALSRQLGVTYYTTPLGVELAYSGKDFGPMVERIYTVAPHFFDAETGGDEGDDDDDDFSSSSSRVVVKRVNPVVALKEMGISFPEGSGARYDAASRRLTVRNTPYNQEEIAGLLSVPLDAPNRSVVLNVMAVEVDENDLKELGFEWLVNLSVGPEAVVGGGVMTTAALAGWPKGGNVNSQERVNGTTMSATEGLRSGNQALSADNIDRLISTGGVTAYNESRLSSAKAPGILSLRGIWNTGDVTVFMRGLSQKKGADVLYNPRLVFTPGSEQQVTFTNVREMFYPETYSEPQIGTMSFSLSNTLLSGATNQTGSGRATVATASHPEEFTRFGMTEDSVGGIGTVVQVHDAQVAQDGQLVTLALTVTLNDFEGFINWGSPIESVMTTDNGAAGIVRVTLTKNHILKPVFKRHMENTKVSVAPGSVLVMGGLQEARSVKFEDKLPVLGDLPLVGRLFRSEGSQKSRKAFLFFVKVDLVDPTGRDPQTGARPNDVTLAD